MKNAKRVIIPVVIVLVVLLALNSCKDTLGAVIDQATGKADTVQEEGIVVVCFALVVVVFFIKSLMCSGAC